MAVIGSLVIKPKGWKLWICDNVWHAVLMPIEFRRYWFRLISYWADKLTTAYLSLEVDRLGYAPEVLIVDS